MKTKNVPEVLKWKINPTFFVVDKPNWGGGRGFDVWEVFPHNPVFLSESDPYDSWRQVDTAAKFVQDIIDKAKTEAAKKLNSEQIVSNII